MSPLQSLAPGYQFCRAYVAVLILSSLTPAVDWNPHSPAGETWSGTAQPPWTAFGTGQEDRNVLAPVQVDSTNELNTPVLS